jgi:nitrogen fixation-related uncharacterized protein
VPRVRLEAQAHLVLMDSQARREYRVRLASKEQPDWLDRREQLDHPDKKVTSVLRDRADPRVIPDTPV